ncbi:uncharacterized protein LOC123296102 [Chrysoperla carnea]|uniref:uncharacterized protein LOC123296102 n=1 Tax=Chrysoperla carnea TaxID=189513 RepID=UPI001D06F4F1|nr:uncharacterized protein LOC123296102 [Chrysoperla carnea]
MKLIIIGVVLIWITILPSNIAEKIRESEDIWKQSPLEYDEQCVKWCTNNKKTKGLFVRPHQYNSPIQMSNQRINDLRADKKTELFPPEFFEEFYEKIKQDGQLFAQKSQIDHTVQDHQQLPNREYLKHIFEDNIGHPLKKHTNFEQKLQSKISGKGSANPVSQEEPMDSMEGKQLIINQDNIMEGPSAGYLGNNMQGLSQGYPNNNIQGPPQGYPDNNMQGSLQPNQGNNMEGSNKKRPGKPRPPLQLPKFPSLSSFPSIMKPPPMCPIGCMPVPFFQPPKFPFIV